MYKHVDGGKAAVCRFELDPRRAHESPAYALKKGLPLTFRVFFSPEASGELSTGMPELGVEISDFHDAQSVDCRLECTMVDKRGKVVHKSVCEQWTFERAKRERWSVRVAPSRLEAERKSGRLFADFRVEWKPPDWRKEEESVEMSPPTTFKLPLVNLQESLPAVGPSTSSVQASDEPHSAATQPSSNFLPTARGDQPAPPLPSASRTNNGANLSALNQPIVLVPRPPSSFAPLPRFGVLSSEGQQSAATLPPAGTSGLFHSCAGR
ncbi:hypothetical protein M3Y99_00525600 [Aphelenchoides fujianensis]|nr:hypothetical protein M3Y99_00525600 [Aphelenchoides fujianensis]